MPGPEPSIIETVKKTVRILPVTNEAIEAIAHDKRKTHGEVVDEAVEALKEKKETKP